MGKKGSTCDALAHRTELCRPEMGLVSTESNNDGQGRADGTPLPFAENIHHLAALAMQVKGLVSVFRVIEHND